MSGRVLVWPLVLVLGLALVAQTVRCRDRLNASRKLHTVEATTLAAYRAQRTDILRANIEVLRQAARRDPLEVGIPVARGSEHLLLGQPQAAIDAYEEALRLEPRPETYLYLGRALDLAGRTDEAARAFRLALRIDPSLLPQTPLAYRDRSRSR
ncbi:MAG TPA: tetratricopeptide repeat protein [Thermoanaerobaculia bacterium]|nr:tetratricopeptide repeat protein [Thermoanaerobaculia bacterium]